MSRLNAIVDRLPSVYRPELREGAAPATLFEALLAAVAGSLDQVHRDAGEILQSRWLDYADRADYDRFFALSRALDPSLEPRHFPYIRDLARVAALLPLTPWEQPPELRERVEDFRLRVGRVVRLYRDGLTTLDAVRAVVKAMLPVDLTVPETQQDRPFGIEEFAGFGAQIQVSTRGDPARQLGPMTRFTLRNLGRAEVHPTFYIQGLAPELGGPGAVTNPLVELYKQDSPPSFPRLGLGLRATLAAGQTLRLRPAHSAWAAAADGPQRAQSLPVDPVPANPAVDGPWNLVLGAPIGAASAIYQSADRVLWTSVADGAGGSSLWRFDGRNWTETLTGLSEVRALLEDGQDLLLATAAGLHRMPLYPVPAGSFSATEITALAGAAVNALYRDGGGQIWVGTDAALLQLAADDSVTPFGLGSRPALETPVLAIAEDATGTLLIGTALGAFQYQRASGRWSRYEGTAATEQVRDWQDFDPLDPNAALPAVDAPFLPPVRSLHRGADGALWLGTEAGFARYLARPPLTPSGDQVGTGLSFVTVLEGFPDVDAGSVFNIREDAHGRVYFAAQRGLFRFDGRDLWQRQADVWVQLGRADRLYPADRASGGRGTWRFDRGSARWQRFELQAGRWNDFAEPTRSADEAQVRDLLWSADVSPDIGTWDGSSFSNPVAVDPADLVVRVKPDETRIVDGGIPGLPPLAVGATVWRYLSMEPAGYTPPTPEPVWSPEGRQIGTPAQPMPEAPGPGRFDLEQPFPLNELDRSVFPYPPEAQLWVAWSERRSRSLLVRLDTASGTKPLDPSIVERVWQGIQLVRPAGVRAVLAVDEQIVKVQNGNS